MYEESDAFEVREKIMATQVVMDMGVHESATLVGELKGKSLQELEKKLDELSEC
jgi:hypothetical protein